MKRMIGFLTLAAAICLPLMSAASSLKSVDDAQIKELPSSVKLVLLNFWATWCVPCRSEIPALNRLQERYPDVRFIGINLDDPENEGAIPGFLKKYPIRYDIVRRSGRNFEETAASMDPQWKGGIPATFVFAEGKQVFRKIGIIDETELDKVLQNVAGKP